MIYIILAQAKKEKGGIVSSKWRLKVKGKHKKKAQFFFTTVVGGRIQWLMVILCLVSYNYYGNQGSHMCSS